MLSYRHGYHAGNLADVLKHTVLTCVLRAMSRKAKPLLYLDTHAGAGRYDLRSRAAASRGEFRDGVDRLRAAAALDGDAVPDDVRAYLDLVDEALRDARNPGYPSGADIAARLLRRTDRLVLAERHPADAAAASKHFARARNVTLFEGDGYACLRSHLPPREGRGLVLIDPAFELRAEADHLVAGLREALARFRHGTYLVWYPRAGKLDWPRLVDRVARLGAPQLLEVTLGAPNARGGAIPSGVLLLNPPYSALTPLEATHAWLVDRIGAGEGAWQWLARADASSTR
jgi:23S rRNA (adenine2030-N6)-methyltransferase